MCVGFFFATKSSLTILAQIERNKHVGYLLKFARRSWHDELAFIFNLSILLLGVAGACSKAVLCSATFASFLLWFHFWGILQMELGILFVVFAGDVFFGS